MYQVFNTEKEFQQAAFNYVSMVVSEYAADYISGGNEADVGEETLDYLVQVAKFKSLNTSKISIYLQIIAQENQLIRDFDLF